MEFPLRDTFYYLFLVIICSFLAEPSWRGHIVFTSIFINLAVHGRADLSQLMMVPLQGLIEWYSRTKWHPRISLAWISPLVCVTGEQSLDLEPGVTFVGILDSLILNAFGTLDLELHQKKSLIHFYPCIHMCDTPGENWDNWWHHLCSLVKLPHIQFGHVL